VDSPSRPPTQPEMPSIPVVPAISKNRRRVCLVKVSHLIHDESLSNM
jgi:hypothetical protein